MTLVRMYNDVDTKEIAQVLSQNLNRKDIMRFLEELSFEMGDSSFDREAYELFDNLRG